MCIYMHLFALELMRMSKFFLSDQVFRVLNRRHAQCLLSNPIKKAKLQRKACLLSYSGHVPNKCLSKNYISMLHCFLSELEISVFWWQDWSVGTFFSFSNLLTFVPVHLPAFVPVFLSVFRVFEFNWDAMLLKEYGTLEAIPLVKHLISFISFMIQSTVSVDSLASTPSSSSTEDHLHEFEDHALQYAVKSLKNL